MAQLGFRGNRVALIKAFLVVLIMGLPLGLVGGRAHGGALKVDPANSSLVVRLFKDGLAARLGHDHVVHATEFSGTVDYDSATPDASSLTIEVRTASLKADDPMIRRKFGLSGEISAGDLADIEKAMKAEGQLNVVRFPSITFKSTKIITQPDGQYLVTGRLTIRGVTQDVRFPARVSMEGLQFRGRAELKFMQSSFGYRPYSAVLGAIKNKDEVALHIELVATP